LRTRVLYYIIASMSINYAKILPKSDIKQHHNHKTNNKTPNRHIAFVLLIFSHKFAYYGKYHRTTSKSQKPRQNGDKGIG